MLPFIFQPRSRIHDLRYDGSYKTYSLSPDQILLPPDVFALVLVHFVILILIWKQPRPYQRFGGFNTFELCSVCCMETFCGFFSLYICFLFSLVLFARMPIICNELILKNKITLAGCPNILFVLLYVNEHWMLLQSL